MKQPTTRQWLVLIKLAGDEKPGNEIVRRHDGFYIVDAKGHELQKVGLGTINRMVDSGWLHHWSRPRWTLSARGWALIDARRGEVADG